MITGKTLYNWAEKIFPIHRSITGDGVRKTLSYIKKIVPNLKIKSIPSGKKVFGWTIPQEWVIKDAYIKKSNGIDSIPLSFTNIVTSFVNVSFTL